MTLSSSLSLFRRFSRKNKRQPSELATDPQAEDVSPSTPLPQGELSSSYIIATRSTISTTTTSRQSTLGRDQQDKGERKRVAETPQEEGDLDTTRKCSKKVAFNEDSEPSQPSQLGYEEPLQPARRSGEPVYPVRGSSMEDAGTYLLETTRTTTTSISYELITASEDHQGRPPIPSRMSSRKLIKRSPLQRDSKPEPINTSGLVRSKTEGRNRTRSADGSREVEQVDESMKMSPWRTWGRRNGEKRTRSDAPPSAWLGNKGIAAELGGGQPPLPPASSLGKRLTKSISFTRPKETKIVQEPEQLSAREMEVAGFARALEARKDRGKMELVQTPGETVYGIGWQPEDSIKPYILLRPLSPMTMPAPDLEQEDKEIILSASPDPRSPETPISAMEMNSEDWNHAAGSTDTHGTTVYAESSGFSHDSNCTPALSIITGSFSPSACPTRQSSLSMSPALLTPASTHMMAHQSDLLYRKSTTARRPRLQRSLAMSQISVTGLEDELGESVPSEQEVVRLNKIDGKRKNRQSLMQIEDDMAFAKVVTELMRAEKEEQVREEETEGWMMIRDLGSPSLEMTKHAKTMRAFFLVRELLNGERNYRRHLVKGIEMLMEDTLQTQAYATGYDPITTNSISPSKLTKQQKRSTSFINLPVYAASKDAMSKEETSTLTKSAPGTLKRGNRPQSFHVARSNSDFGERRNRTFSDLTALASGTPPDRQRICEDLLKHMRDLCIASRRLANGLEFDPSPNEAAAMFLKNEDALLSVYSEWASIVGEAMLSGIPTKIPARAAARSKDATRQRRRSLRYGSKDNDIPAGELLLADIIIKPTARAGQYILLFQEILDCLVKSHEDTTLIEAALASAKRLVAECDRRQATDMSTVASHNTGVAL